MAFDLDAACAAAGIADQDSLNVILADMATQTSLADLELERAARKAQAQQDMNDAMIAIDADVNARQQDLQTKQRAAVDAKVAAIKQAQDVVSVGMKIG
jgi:hypothetical protein